MTDMSRQEFLKLSAMGLAATAIPKSLWSMTTGTNVDQELLKMLVDGNDESVVRFEEFIKENPNNMRWYRPLTSAFAAFTAAYCHPDSKYYKSANILKLMDQAISPLLKLQYPSGLLDSGGNRQSPPDTAFYLEALCPAAVVLKKNDLKETDAVEKKLDTFLLKAGEGIRTGGVHTPNHRWAVSSVLAQLYVLFQNDKYLKRLDDWLGEGSYINEDGNYPEKQKLFACRNRCIYHHWTFIKQA